MRRETGIGATARRASGRRALLPASAALLGGFVLVCAFDDGGRVRFSFGGSDASGVDSSSIVIVFTDADRSRTFDGRDFRVTTASPTPRSPSFETSGSGLLAVDVRVRGQAGEGPSAGRVTLPLGDGRRYDVSVAVGRESALRRCSGCREVRAFPLDPASGAAGDSLYVGWTSTETSDPVVR